MLACGGVVQTTCVGSLGLLWYYTDGGPPEKPLRKAAGLFGAAAPPRFTLTQCPKPGRELGLTL